MPNDTAHIFPALEDKEAYELIMLLRNWCDAMESHYFAQIRRYCVGSLPIFEVEILY